MPSKPKQPQDHKPKKSAIDRVREEAKSLPGLDEMAGLTLKVEGRNGEVQVTTIESPLDWDAEVIHHLGAGDYLSAICGMLEDHDAARLRAVRPSIGSLMAALMEPVEDTGEESPGESLAS